MAKVESSRSEKTGLRRKTDEKRRVPFEKFVYGGLTQQECLRLRHRISRENNRVFHYWNRAGIIINSILFILSFVRVPGNFLWQLKLVFVIFASIFGTLAFATDAAKNHERISITMNYLMLLALAAESITIDGAMKHGMPATMFFVCLVVIPLVITDLPVRVITLQLIVSAAFLTISRFRQTPDVFTVNMIDTGVFLLFGIIIGCYSLRKSLRGFSLQKQTEAARDRDDLTGLLNKDAGKQRISNWIAEHNREKGALVIFDLDNFKGVNDTLGHKKGDDVLSVMGNVIREEFRDGDILCRFGGDEFVVFLPGVSDEKSVSEILGRVQPVINERAGKTAGVPVTCSFGVAFYSEESRENYSFDRTFINADKALYVSKRGGKNMVSFY